MGLGAALALAGGTPPGSNALVVCAWRLAGPLALAQLLAKPISSDGGA